MNKIIIFSFFSLVLIFPLHSKVQFSKTYTSFACDKGRVCIVGHHQVGSHVTLLNFKTKKYCSAKVEKNDRYSDEAISFKRSILKDLNNCTRPYANYSDAINTKVNSFNIIAFEKESKPRPASTGDIEKFLAQARTVEQWIGKKKIPFKSSYFEKIMSKSKTLQLDGTKIELTKSSFYRKGKLYANGAYTLKMKEQKAFVSDLCTDPKETMLFKLNDILFLKTYSYCCECGWNAKEYFKLESNKIIKVSSDSSSST